MANEARAVFATRDDVPITAEGGVETALLLDPADTAGRSAAREITAASGGTVALSDELAHRYVFVVAGDWRFVIGDNQRAALPGTMIQLPAATSATAALEGGATGRLLVVTLPASPIE